MDGMKTEEEVDPNGPRQLHKTLYRVHLFQNYSSIYVVKIALLKRAGECGVKDQVRRADSLNFVRDALKHRMLYGECAMERPVFFISA